MVRLSIRVKSLKPKKGEKRKAGSVQIGGIWKGVRISSKDIKEVRKTLLEKIEEKSYSYI